jgi:hypothetical protein
LIRTMGSWFGLMPFSGVKPLESLRRREGSHTVSDPLDMEVARPGRAAVPRRTSSHYDPVK